MKGGGGVCIPSMHETYLAFLNSYNPELSKIPFSLEEYVGILIFGKISSLAAASVFSWWDPSVFLEHHGSAAGRLQGDGGLGFSADDWFYWLENWITLIQKPSAHSGGPSMERRSSSQPRRRTELMFWPSANNIKIPLFLCNEQVLIRKVVIFLFGKDKRWL